MALLTASEFADICIIKRTSLASYENRGKIVATGSGKAKKYDSDNEINKAFIQRMSAKGMAKDEESGLINHIAKFPVKPGKADQEIKKALMDDYDDEEDEPEIDRNGIPAMHVSEKILKFRDVQKRESEIELNGLKIQKQRGEVVPAVLIQPIFLQNNQFILQEFKNAIDETLRHFSKMKDLTPEESAELKGIMTERLNEAMRTAVTNTAASVKSIINDYTSKRAAGERL